MIGVVGFILIAKTAGFIRDALLADAVIYLPAGAVRRFALGAVIAHGE